MAKNLTAFVKTIGVKGAGDPNEGVWEYSNERIDAFACGGFSNDTTVVWCVPTGVSTARFEVWGAGGKSGSPGTCCGIGPPSSSGAYAYKKIPVTPGDCYTVFAGITWCTSPCRCPTDHRVAAWGSECCQMFNTWITGTGLTNFCANKGHDSCYIYCGDFGANLISSIDSDETFLWNDSQNAPQACYYGADGGERGYNGYVFVPNNGNPVSTGQFCSWRSYVPYPAGLITKKPGRALSYMCCNQSGCVGNGFADTFGYGVSSCRGAFMAGSGTPIGMSCAGSVECSLRNIAGRVRITYS